MATVVRDAIDRYLGELAERDVVRTLQLTFGAIPSIVRRRRTDWSRRGRRPC